MIPKFRVWNKKTESFIDYGDIMLDLKNAKVYAGDVGIPEYTIDVTKQVIIMQYTGLKDKNGVEIFEGDIVRYTWDLPDDVNATEKGKKIRVGKVFWSDWRASFAVGKKSVNSDLFRYVRNGNTVEVIGNIYENSDLLEVTE